MAATRKTGVLTRQMLRRAEGNTSTGTGGEGSGEGGGGGRNLGVFAGKKTSGKQAKEKGAHEEGSVVPFDGLAPQVRRSEKTEADEVFAACNQSCRTFPLQHGDQMCKGEGVGRRQPKTEAVSKQKKTLAERSRNVGQAQRKATRQTSDNFGMDTCTKANGTQPNNADRKFESTEMAVAMFNTRGCSVVVTPMEVCLPETPAEANLTTTVFCDDSSSNGVSSSSTDQVSPIPKDVVDIDEHCDTLAPPTYSREVVQYWTNREAMHAMEEGFLTNSPGVIPRMRAVVMDWLLQVQDHEELQDETLHLCRVLIDRMLTNGGVVMARLQLLGITCLLIASKFCERFCTEVKTLCYLTDHTYSADQVIEYEREILVTLDWDISRPVCTHFLERYLQVHPHPAELFHLSMYLLDLSVTSTKLACVLPSKLAASALLLARRLLMSPVGFDADPAARGFSLCVLFDLSLPWTRALHFYTGYKEADLLRVEEEFDAILAKAPSSKFQGARNKYNTEKRCFISFNPKLYVMTSMATDREMSKLSRPS